MVKCKICGQENCKKHSILLSKVRKLDNFSGSSPPEIFVGKYGYPNVYTGILSPEEYGDTQILSSHELWHERRLPIHNILSLRNKLIYGRTQSYIKKPKNTKFYSTFQEVAMTSKPISTHFILKKPISVNKEKETYVPLIANAAHIQSIHLEENTKIENKVDYLVNDTEVKSKIAINELEKHTQTSTIIKILSAGLLGLKANRKLVPTRWSITAVDDTLSKAKIEKIKYHSEIQDFQVFTAEYLGNHYEFLLLPDKWSFEVIEISLKSPGVWQDYETFFKRKTYADSVTGAYYANRLALTEYLEKIKKQCSCIVFREIRPEYYAPLGVGILRQTSRQAFTNQPIKFDNLKSALENIQSRLKQNILNYTEKSYILKNFGKQSKLSNFL